MEKSMPKITKRFVETLRPDTTGRDVFAWDAGDGALKGFGIRVKPSGAASYFIQYRNHEGRTRRLVLGRIGELTPDEARQLATDKLRDARKGADPSADRHAARNASTVAEVCDLYLSHGRGTIKPSTLEMDRSRIECHVKPLLGRRGVAGLTRRDIERFQADIAAGKTARPRRSSGRSGETTGGRAVAARTVGMLGAILELAKRHGAIAENPARGVRRFPDNKRRRFLSLDEVTALGKAMRDAETNGENQIASRHCCSPAAVGMKYSHCPGLGSIRKHTVFGLKIRKAVHSYALSAPQLLSSWRPNHAWRAVHGSFPPAETRAILSACHAFWHVYVPVAGSRRTSMCPCRAQECDGPHVATFIRGFRSSVGIF